MLLALCIPTMRSHAAAHRTAVCLLSSVVWPLVAASIAASQPLPWSPQRVPLFEPGRPLVSAANPPAGRPGPQGLLIRNPDRSDGRAAFALADEFGRVQRYIEPSPGIDLADYVGERVRVAHDTGETLLASQLLLPNRRRHTDGQIRLAEDVQEAEKIDTPQAAKIVDPVPHVAPIVIDDLDAGRSEFHPGYFDAGAFDSSALDSQSWGGGHFPAPFNSFGDCCAYPGNHNSSLFGAFLFLHATGADMHHAQQQNGTGGAGTTPFGGIAVADPHLEPGFRVGGSWALSHFNSIAVSYTFLETDAISSIRPPSSVGGGLGTVGSLVHHPQAVITSSAGPVRANYDIDVQLIDVDYRQLLGSSPVGWVNYSVGLRYADLEQHFRQTGVFGGSQGGVIRTSSNVDFDGFGLRFGLDGERMLGASRFSVYGNSSFAATFGEFDGNYRMRNATTVSDLAIVRWADDRIAPMLEYELGLAWTSCNGNWRVAVGYTVIHWFNVVTTPVFIDAVQADNYVDLGDTLTFDGLTSSVEWRF